MRAPSAAFAWLAWLMAVCGWILMLSGLSALQRVSPAALAMLACWTPKGGTSSVTQHQFFTWRLTVRSHPPRRPTSQNCSGSTFSALGTAGYLVRTAGCELCCALCCALLDWRPPVLNKPVGTQSCARLPPHAAHLCHSHTATVPPPTNLALSCLPPVTLGMRVLLQLLMVDPLV